MDKRIFALGTSGWVGGVIPRSARPPPWLCWRKTSTIGWQSPKESKTKKNRIGIGLRPFFMRVLFLEVASGVFFCFQESLCPVTRENRAGSSQNESDYYRRGTQIRFPLLEGLSCENFGLAPFSLSSQKSGCRTKWGLCLINCFFLARKFQIS